MKRSTLLSYSIALSILGLADSWYLMEAELNGSKLSCSIEGLDGCNAVAQSIYSHLFGIPLGVYGVAFYALILLASIALMGWDRAWLRNSLALLGGLGVAASLIFVYIQLVLIQAVCIYCLGSGLISLLLCGVGFAVWRNGLPAKVAESAGVATS